MSRSDFPFHRKKKERTKMTPYRSRRKRSSFHRLSVGKNPAASEAHASKRRATSGSPDDHPGRISYSGSPAAVRHLSSGDLSGSLYPGGGWDSRYTGVYADGRSRFTVCLPGRPERYLNQTEINRSVFPKKPRGSILIVRPHRRNSAGNGSGSRVVLTKSPQPAL